MKHLFFGIVLACTLVFVLWWSQPRDPQPADTALPPAIAYFEAHAGGCAWYVKYPHDSRTRKLAQLQTDCSGAQAALHPKGDLAVVWFVQSDEPPMQWLVNLRRYKQQRLPAPPYGELQAFAFNQEGALLAFTIDQNAPLDSNPQGSFLKFAGKTYPLPEDHTGVYGLAHALQWSQGSWQLIETQAAPCCETGAKGIYSLGSFEKLSGNARHLNLQSAHLLKPYRDAATILDTMSLARIQAKTALPNRHGFWKTINSLGWQQKLLVFASGSSPSPMTALVVAEDNGVVRHLEGWKTDPNRLIAIQDVGRFALLSEAYTGEEPKVYDMVLGKLVLESTTWQGAIFWPFAKAN